MGRFNRRIFLRGAGAVAAGVAAGRLLTEGSDTALEVPRTANQQAALAVLGRSTLRQPDSLPFPDLPPGTDTLPQIQQIVVLMLENHSYDNIFGLLDRGDGYTLDKGLAASQSAWNPYGVTATNPLSASGNTVQYSFLMPGTTQLDSQPSQEWEASHVQYAGGANDGFVISASGPVAMGYFDSSLLPFTYGLAERFPVADRWFCSMLGQTDPNRRFLIAATAAGMTDDIEVPDNVASFSSGIPVNPLVQDALLATPTNGTIFDRLSAYGISWCDYTASYPTGTTSELFPLDDAAVTQVNYQAVDNFFSDSAAGSLPAFTLLDPDYSTQSQENPQDVSVGEAFLHDVVKALFASPQWRTTLLVVTYDEHGGYYDHVPPPVALVPDSIPPVVASGESTYDGYARYGFRVPTLVVSPFAIPGGLTHAVYDQTSILAMVESKWNLPAMTYRDANANDLTGFLDMAALQAKQPTFAEVDISSFAGSGSSQPHGPIPPAGSQGPPA